MTIRTTLLGAILVIALTVVPCRAMQEHDTGTHSDQDHVMEADQSSEAMHGDMDHGTMDHEAMENESMNHETMDAEHDGHDMDHAATGDDQPMEHDHEAMMEEAGDEVGITEKTGGMLADVNFTDSHGRKVNLLELTRDIPTVILPIYYRCPDVCNLLQGSFAEILPDVALKPGEEFQVLSISFDPREGTAQAARAKRTYLAAAGGQFPPDDWKFLVGDAHSINSWLKSIGYTVKREGGLWAHPVAAVVVSPGGTISRYLYGTTFLPFDVTMAATEAGAGKTGLSVKRLLSVCYSYDPQGRRYVFNILRVAGFGIVGFIALFVTYLIFSGRKRKKG